MLDLYLQLSIIIINNYSISKLKDFEEDKTIPAKRFSRKGLTVIPVTTVKAPTMKDKSVAGTWDKKGIRPITNPITKIAGITIFLLIEN